MKYLVVNVFLDLNNFLNNTLDQVKIVNEQKQIDFATDPEHYCVVLDNRAFVHYDQVYDKWNTYITLFAPQDFANQSYMLKYINNNRTKILQILCNNLKRSCQFQDDIVDDLKLSRAEQAVQIDDAIRYKKILANKILDIQSQI